MLEIDALLERRPGQLSGGQRQRVAIGRAIVRNPVAFLLDEPLSNLDAELRVSMRAEIAALHARLGTTMIYVTHDQVEAMTLADRIVVLRAGAIEQVGTPLELYNRPANRFVAGFIGAPAMNFLPAGRPARRPGRRRHRRRPPAAPPPRRPGRPRRHRRRGPPRRGPRHRDRAARRHPRPARASSPSSPARPRSPPAPASPSPATPPTSISSPTTAAVSPEIIWMVSRCFPDAFQLAKIEPRQPLPNEFLQKRQNRPPHRRSLPMPGPAARCTLSAASARAAA